MIAVISIDVQVSYVNDEYDYIIPPQLEDYVKIGSRVLVEFGVRKVLGFVIDIKDKSDFKGTLREVVQVLDFDSELSLEQIMIAKEMSKSTKTYLSSCLSVMYPYFLKSKFRKFISINNVESLDPHIISLFDNKKKISLTSDLLKEYPKIRKEINNGNLLLDYDLYSYGKTKQVKEYFVNRNCENIYSKYKGIKKKLIDYLMRKEYATLDEIKEFIGCSSYIIKSLERDEVLYYREVKPKVDNNLIRPKLSNKIFDFDGKIIKQKYLDMSNKPFLLYSNDEKFSFDFFLDICIDNINNNKKTMIVCPTLISLYNIYYYLHRYLEGYDVVNLSGDLSNSEYYENYKKITSGNFDCFVTSKVGIFTKTPSLATIIVYDEGNYNYISEMTPKYNSIEILKLRANYHNAKIVMHSSPLTIENYYHYFLADYNLLKYIKKTNNNVSIVDMQDELLQNRLLVSKKLEEGINKALAKDKQVMLILNSKGYSNTLKCRKCGKVIKCEKCNIPLTYYKDKNEFKCRYCGKGIENITCKCGCTDFAMYDMGLEMLKEKLDYLFPLSKILLIDSNTLKEYSDYENVVVSIESKDVDIIIGTSNALGLSHFADLDLISLVSVDTILNYSDYKASFNTFALIYNSVNTNTLNKNLLNYDDNINIIIQGFNLNHYAIKYGISLDFNAFYEEEIKFRKTFNYPPFREVNKIIITGEYKDIYYCANYFKKVYSSVTKTQNMVLGPVYVKIKKGVQLIIKSDDFEKLSKIIDEVKNKFKDKDVLISFERYPRSL